MTQSELMVLDTGQAEDPEQAEEPEPTEEPEQTPASGQTKVSKHTKNGPHHSWWRVLLTGLSFFFLGLVVLIFTGNANSISHHRLAGQFDDSGHLRGLFL